MNLISPSRRRVAALFHTSAGLMLLALLAPVAALRFPEVLLDDPALAASLVGSRPVMVVAALLCLPILAAGLVVLTAAVAPRLPLRHRRPMVLCGRGAAVCWALAGVLCLILIPLWTSGSTVIVTVLSRAAFGCAAVVAPVLLAVWTTLVARSVTTVRLLGHLSTIGLLSTAARSVMWVVNAGLPAESGLHGFSSHLTTATLLIGSLWILWSVLVGIGWGREEDGTGRGRLRIAGRRLATGLLTLGFALASPSAVIVLTPVPRAEAVPSVPSAAGSVLYSAALTLSGVISPPTTYQELLDERQSPRYTSPTTPAGVSLEKVDAKGVAAEYICAAGATKDRTVLYLHGGGFVMPMSNGHRQFAAAVSRETGACVLLPHYRLAPEHPFPAALDDTRAAYGWLLDQGVAASRIAVTGDSCGGTLTLSLALSLRDEGEPLPSSLMPLSPATDLTLEGETYRTNAAADPVLDGPGARFFLDSYTDNLAIDPRDPLVSPLFGDPEGLPATLLIAGTQEVLVSDATRMATSLESAGVTVKLELWPGMIHTWPVVEENLMESGLAVEHMAAFFARHGR